jgi:PAS domain S-box-containing protein
MNSQLGALLLALSRGFNLSPEGPSIGVWDWDVPNDIVYADAVAARLFGLQELDAATGRPLSAWTERMHPGDRARVARTIALASDGEQRFVETYRVARIDGGFRWIHAIGDCILAPDGTPLRYSGLMIDVSGGSRSESAGVLRIDPKDVVVDLTVAARDAALQLGDDFLLEMFKMVLFHLLDRAGGPEQRDGLRH